MTTRQIAFTIGISLLSAVAAVVVYHFVAPPKQIVIREDFDARYIRNSDWVNDIRPRTFLSAMPTDFTQAADAVTPSVAFIRAFHTEKGDGLMGLLREEYSTTSGSGVVISSDGYIVTNNHVVEGGVRFEVILNDKREFSATIVGNDPSTDLALLKIEAEHLLAVEIGNSDSLRVGEWVLAVGNPFNLESTVTAGIVSAKGRNIDILEGQDRIESFIQTDAVVNPGNSGGALVNTNGELVGINTAIITRSGGYEGYSFAIPVNLVSKIVRDLRDYGSVQRGLLGAYIDNVTAGIAEAKKLRQVAGVLVTRVAENSGAENAGLHAGDVIIAINGKSVRDVPALQEILGQLRPGDEVKVTYVRNQKENAATITLKNKMNSTSSLSASEEQLLHQLGFELRNLSRDEQSRLGVKGAKVMSIFRGSQVEATNMEPGFVITSINNKQVSDVEHAIRLLKRTKGSVVISGIYEHYEGEYYYSFDKE
ncbi:MAG: trypsin-like peptidase domain-containing protein [Saprospiraceae bacterium]